MQIRSIVFLLAVLCPFSSVLGAPVNDFFAEAVVVQKSGEVWEAMGTTEEATREPNEPLNTNGVASVWFKWTSETNGVVSVDVEDGKAEGWFFRNGTGSLSELVRLPGDRVAVVGGEIYYMAVYSPLGEGSAFRLVVRAIPPKPVNDDFANAVVTSFTDGVAAIEGTTVGATVEEGEIGEGDASIWYRWTAMVEGVIQHHVEAGEVLVGMYEGGALSALSEVAGNRVEVGREYFFRVASTNGGEGAFRVTLTRVEPEPPVNDLFTNAIEVFGETNFLTGDFERATGEAGEVGLNGGVSFPERTLWWKYKVPETGKLLLFTEPILSSEDYSAFRGESLDALEPLYGGGLGDGRFIAVEGGDTIHVQVQKRAATPLFKGLWMVCSIAPVNDHFEDAWVVDSARIVGHNIGASGQPGETISANGGGKTVWYQWTAPFEGRAIIGSPNTMVQVYKEGPALADLMLETNTFFRPIQKDEVFYIQVDTIAPEGRVFTLNITAEDARPINDHFAKAITWTNAYELTGIAPLKYLTREPGEPVHASYPHKSAWWRWEAPADGIVEFEGAWNSTNVAGAAIYIGDSVEALELVAKSDGILTARVQGGMTYHVVFSAPEETEGTMLLFSHFIARPYGDEVPGNIIQNGSFEATLEPWTGSGVVEHEIFGGDFAAHGTNFARLKVAGSSIEQEVETESGQSYELRFSYWYPWNSVGGRVRVMWNGEEVGQLQADRKRYVRMAKVTSSGTNSVVRFEAVEGSIEIDAVSVSVASDGTPAITQEPRPQRVIEGGRIDLRVGADGIRPMFYEWYRNGARLTNQRDAVLILTNASVADAGSYQVAISNAAGSIKSTNARVEVIGVTNTTIFVQPASRSLFEGEYHALSVFAAGPGPLEYQWEKDGELLGGATDRDLVFTHLVAANAGEYRVRVSSGEEELWSEAATIEVAPAFIQPDGGLRIDLTYRSAVYDIGGIVPVEGEKYVSQFFFGTSVTDLRPFDQPVPFFGTPQQVDWSIPAIPKEATTYFQMRVWERGYGPTFEHARAAGGAYGQSPILQVERVEWGEDRWTIITVESFAVVPGIYGFVMPGVERVSQEIDFSEIADQEYTGASVPLIAQASSGLPVTFSVAFGPAVIANSSLFVMAPGKIGVEAAQVGNANYFPAEVVSREFEVLPGRQAITFPAIQTNGVPQLYATASSGLPVEYDVVQGLAVIVGNSVTEIGEGPITIRASQAGNLLFGPATPVERTFIIRLIGQSIVFEKLPDMIVGNDEGGAVEMLRKSSAQPATNDVVRLRAFATSGLPVSYTLLSGPAVLTGNVVQPTGLGEVRVRAVQEGDVYFKPAQSIEQRFYVLERARAAQTISFNLPSIVTLSTGPLRLTASASSGLPVTFTVVSGPGRVEGLDLWVDEAGTVVVEAMQIGNGEYLAASARDSIIIISTPEITMSVGEDAVILRWAASEMVRLEMADSPAGPWDEVEEIVTEGEFAIPRYPEGAAKFYRIAGEVP